MKITALVENTAETDVKAVHGLSLYIETPDNKILFDLGPDNTLIENSKTLGIDLSCIDTVVISHGHSDHGGALEQFLQVNSTAKIYVQRKAFEEHYSKLLFKKRNIGLSPQLAEHPQIVLVDGDYAISDSLKLFTAPSGGKFRSTANNTLYTAYGRDDFAHEHSLVVLGDGEANVVFIGCGHAGVVNILERAAEYNPKVCIGGYHLWNPSKKKTVPERLLKGISQELLKHKVRFYTCHCTGNEAYTYLQARVPDMTYLRCGQTITA